MAKETVSETQDLQAQVHALQATVEMLTSAMRQGSGGGITAEQLRDVMKEVVTVQADAHKAAMKEIAERDQRDDLNYPRKSVFSYPEGDKARPRPELKCPMLWVGGAIDYDTTTASEIEYLNQYEPGDYTFKRTDGVTTEKLTVTGERTAAGKVSKLSFAFPTKEQRDTLPTMVSILRDGLGIKSPMEDQIARLLAKVAALEAQSGANVVTV